MCGIFGLVVGSGTGMGRAQWQDALTRLFLLSESRGREAAGIALATHNRIVVHKDSVSAAAMLRQDDYKIALDRGVNGFFETSPGKANGGSSKQTEPADRGSLAAIGHCRLVTNGLQGIDANNQPVCRKDAVVVHNGIVVNVDNIWAKQTDMKPSADVDTEVIAALVEKNRSEMPVTEAVRRTFGEIYGETSIAMLFRDLDAMVLATNTGSLFLVRSRDGKAMFFASEAYICRKLTEGSKALSGFEGQGFEQVKAGEGLLIDLSRLEPERFSVNGKANGDDLTAPNVSSKLGFQRAIEDKAKRFEDARKAMKRCTKCVLPETMPFITFDAHGVCNFCHSYQPWIRKPENELLSMFDRHRSKDGKPDCIMAFSGGRDSSYGLHLLKTKYGMNPMCFSYDWGMVTDLARRNQARMCGKLGVEHIWISADIKKKRAHIRRNVSAWLKKPDLGLIPLFMAGDKEVLWHANKLMEHCNIDQMAFCTNELEKTVFKQGLLGIDARESRVGKPSTLPLAGKLGMLWKYSKRFASNPAYLNRSMPDTLFAFFSYYVIQQNYFSLFDYVPWDEDQINKTLIDGYDWETAKDTRSTWRIGDGTAPFYNYIYNSVVGFSEYDTFRSNQIREGTLSRHQAMALVEEENLPRFDSIREYTQMINIDFDEAIRIIDRIPKLYL